MPFTALKKTIEVIKVNGLSEAEIIDLVQEDQADALESSDERFEKVEL